MEKISTEDLISSLLVYGFDKVDNFLYTSVLSKLATDECNYDEIEITGEPISKNFKKYVDYDGKAFKLKEGFTLDSMVLNESGYKVTLRNYLSSSRFLNSYLSGFDFHDVISKKMSYLKIDDTAKLTEEYFSKKEMEMASAINVVRSKRKPHFFWSKKN